jgi:hypothetical protein
VDLELDTEEQDGNMATRETCDTYERRLGLVLPFAFVTRHIIGCVSECSGRREAVIFEHDILGREDAAPLCFPAWRSHALANSSEVVREAKNL